jgi:hypothetical protein
MLSGTCQEIVDAIDGSREDVEEKGRVLSFLYSKKRLRFPKVGGFFRKNRKSAVLAIRAIVLRLTVSAAFWSSACGLASIFSSAICTL